MLRRLRGWLLRHRLSAGDLGAPDIPPGTPCAVGGCTRPATEQWFPSFCSLRAAGEELDWVAICAEHDVQLNEHCVRFLLGDRCEAALAAYRRSRLGV